MLFKINYYYIYIMILKRMKREKIVHNGNITVNKEKNEMKNKTKSALIYSYWIFYLILTKVG